MVLPLEKAKTQGEPALLRRLQQLGFAVVPTFVLDLEAEFYALNNLAEQIKRAFAGVFGARLDEDRLDAACALAQRLVRESYLLPERSEELRNALPPGKWLVRYAGQAPFALEAGSQEAIWALKRLWASRWRLEVVLERSPQLSPPENLTLFQRVDALPKPSAELSQAASKALGQSVKVHAHAGKAVWLES